MLLTQIFFVISNFNGVSLVYFLCNALLWPSERSAGQLAQFKSIFRSTSFFFNLFEVIVVALFYHQVTSLNLCQLCLARWFLQIEPFKELVKWGNIYSGYEISERIVPVGKIFSENNIWLLSKMWSSDQYKSLSYQEINKSSILGFEVEGCSQCDQKKIAKCL